MRSLAYPEALTARAPPATRSPPTQSPEFEAAPEALSEGDVLTSPFANASLPQNGTNPEVTEGAPEDGLPPPPEGQRRAAFSFQESS